MWETLKNLRLLLSLFTTVVIGWNVYTQRKPPFRIEFKYILFHKAAFHQLINSWFESTTVSTWEKLIAAEQKKMVQFLPGSLLKFLWISAISIRLFSSLFLHPFFTPSYANMLSARHILKPRSEGLFPGLGAGRGGKDPGIGWSSAHNQKCQNRVCGETVCAFRLGPAFKRWNFASFCSVIATLSG